MGCLCSSNKGKRNHEQKAKKLVISRRQHDQWLLEWHDLEDPEYTQNVILTARQHEQLTIPKLFTLVGWCVPLQETKMLRVGSKAQGMPVRICADLELRTELAEWNERCPFMLQVIDVCRSDPLPPPYPPQLRPGVRYEIREKVRQSGTI